MEQRREEIRFLLQEHGQLSVTELAQRFSVSEMTIRRDLKVLADLGLVQRQHGGAIYPQNPPADALFITRLGEAEREKTMIGRLAADLVEDDDSIILDAGTTTLAVAKALSARCVVITNSLPIAGILGGRTDMTVLITGGEVRGATSALVGPITRECLNGFNADKLFLAATGIDVERGLSTANMLEYSVKTAMLNAAKEVILVAHSEKMGRVFCHGFAHWDKIDILITDTNLPEETRLALEAQGVKVMLAQV